ncbi:MAG TPA: hypothetical protein PLA27_15850 [Anaerolineales bacterium]|nr:hypothetical protein [Anaerolineales bacterium]HQX17897.1 hypothetical protein [Anaerolineales bacterium]
MLVRFAGLKPPDFDKLNPRLSAWKPFRQAQCDAYGLAQPVRFNGLSRTEVVVEFIETQGFSPMGQRSLKFFSRNV